MSGQWQLLERRLLDLLSDRATFGLTRSEEEELWQLKESLPGFDDECLEKAAATVQLAFAFVEPLPTAVHAKIRASLVGNVTEPSRERRRGNWPDVKWMSDRPCERVSESSTKQTRADNESRY